VVNGDLLLDQPCKNAQDNPYVQPFTGTFSATANNLTLIATVTLHLGPPVTGTVHPIVLAFPSQSLEPRDTNGPPNQPDIVLNGTVANPPPNLETWWVELANSPQIVSAVKSALEAGVASAQAEQWIESILNIVLSQIPAAARLRNRPAGSRAGLQPVP